MRIVIALGTLNSKAHSQHANGARLHRSSDGWEVGTLFFLYEERGRARFLAVAAQHCCCYQREVRGLWTLYVIVCGSLFALLLPRHLLSYYKLRCAHGVTCKRLGICNSSITAVISLMFSYRRPRIDSSYFHLLSLCIAACLPSS